MGRAAGPAANTRVNMGGAWAAAWELRDQRGARMYAGTTARLRRWVAGMVLTLTLVTDITMAIGGWALLVVGRDELRATRRRYTPCNPEMDGLGLGCAEPVGLSGLVASLQLKAQGFPLTVPRSAPTHVHAAMSSCNADASRKRHECNAPGRVVPSPSSPAPVPVPGVPRRRGWLMGSLRVYVTARQAVTRGDAMRCPIPAGQLETPGQPIPAPCSPVENSHSLARPRPSRPSLHPATFTTCPPSTR